MKKPLLFKCYLFTLLELVVCISVIGILAGLLIPVLKTAREKANQISCFGNLRQLGTAIISYAGDNKDFLPMVLPYLPGNPVSDVWWSLLYPELKNTEVFRCPSNPQGDFNTSLNNSSPGVPAIPISYEANGGGGDALSAFGGRPPMGFLEHSLPKTGLWEITNPSDTILLGEACSPNAKYAYFATHDSSSFRFTNHERRTNFQLCDGSARSMKPKDTVSTTWTMWTINNKWTVYNSKLPGWFELWESAPGQLP